MTPEQRYYWQTKLARKIDCGAQLLAAQIDKLPFEEWSQLRIAQEPWYWTGAFHTNARGHNPVARIRSPGRPLFPRQRRHPVQAHRVIFHLLVTPLGPNDQLRYAHHIVGDRPNVNPCHHKHVVNHGYLYEPPSIDEVGAVSEIEELVLLLEDGFTPDALLNEGYTQSQIDEALNARR